MQGMQGPRGDGGLSDIVEVLRTTDNEGVPIISCAYTMSYQGSLRDKSQRHLTDQGIEPLDHWVGLTKQLWLETRQATVLSLTTSAAHQDLPHASLS
jgi:hypothetical protein